VDELLETRWRIRSPEGKFVRCTIYQTEEGVDVRAGYPEEAPLIGFCVSNLPTAQRLADVWRQAILASGPFTDIRAEEETAVYSHVGE
jgi:hypothetical protein